jgi:hypothetical protein
MGCGRLRKVASHVLGRSVVCNAMKTHDLSVIFAPSGLRYRNPAATRLNALKTQELVWLGCGRLRHFRESSHDSAYREGLIRKWRNLAQPCELNAIKSTTYNDFSSATRTATSRNPNCVSHCKCASYRQKIAQPEVCCSLQKTYRRWVALLVTEYQRGGGLCVSSGGGIRRACGNKQTGALRRMEA